MARFTLPRDVYHGENAIEALKTFTGKKAMVLTGGGSMKRFGFLDKIVGYLKEAGMEVETFEGIEPDPSVETVMRGAEAMMKFEPDWIVAVGGGSPIDAAKAMWVKYEYPEITFEEMCKVFGMPTLRRKAHFCAISSTSGTATEVTAFSVITVGIGIPFLIAQGADPVVVGALGLTAGYCGTLMTPMAANFNILPAALLETKNKYIVILSQLPVALVMLAVHIVLMYTLAFR